MRLFSYQSVAVPLQSPKTRGSRWRKGKQRLKNQERMRQVDRKLGLGAVDDYLISGTLQVCCMLIQSKRTGIPLCFVLHSSQKVDLLPEQKHTWKARVELWSAVHQSCALYMTKPHHLPPIQREFNFTFPISPQAPYLFCSVPFIPTNILFRSIQISIEAEGRSFI